jgi:hypothetical protein
MGLGTLVGKVKRFIPPELVPERKVVYGAASSVATTAAVALLTKGKGRKLGLRRRDASKLVAAVSSAVPLVVAYVTSNKPQQTQVTP